MHELGIAQQLIETTAAHLPEGLHRVSVMHVQLGALAGVSKDELLFGFEAMSPNTVCAGARLEITEVAAIAHCPQCAIDFEVADVDQLFCPTCGNAGAKVLQGKELILASVEASEEDADE